MDQGVGGAGVSCAIPVAVNYGYLSTEYLTKFTSYLVVSSKSLQFEQNLHNFNQKIVI